MIGVLVKKIINIIKSELDGIKFKECTAFGSFTNEVNNDKKNIMPGAVYGFFVRLKDEELKYLIDEAKLKSTLKSEKENIRPIIDNVYVLYRGKDKSLGARVNAHIKNKSKGTAIIRLCAYKTLLNKEIACFNIVVNNYKDFESHLQKIYPQVIQTSKNILV